MASRWQECVKGAWDTFPMLVGSLPFGVVFGTLAVASGFSVPGTLAMSLFVFAGSAQLIAVGLAAAGSGLLLICLTTFVVNLRHILYSASLLPQVQHLPQRWRLPLAFLLTDQTYVVAYSYYQNQQVPLEHKHWYFLGSGVAMYLNWFAATLAGVLLGYSLPGLADWGLDFAMTATFIGIVVPLLRSRPMLVAALVAVVVALLANGLPNKLGLMLAAVLGVMAGLWAERLPPRRISTRQDSNTP